MAFEEIKSKGGMDVGMEGERGLVAGRSQREKRRSYKDLLREEEEIAAQVRKSSKKRPKDSELFMLGGDSHKKKKKHSDDYYYRDHDSSGPPPHKKKHKSADRSPPLSSPSSSHPTDTAMGLLQAITSPLATGSDPNPHLHKKPSYPSFSSHSSKDRKRESSSGGGSKGSHSFSNSRPLSSSSSSSKKHSSSSSKSSLFHGGAPKEEPLTLREADGLKMKLIMSPEKEEGESFPFTPHSSKGGVKKEKDRDRMQLSKSPKKKLQQIRDPLPVVGKEVEVEGHYGGGLGDDSSSSGGELEAGELVIDDSYTHLSKKKKKSKKSKKKKDKEKDRDKDKSGKDKKHSKGYGDSSRGQSHSHPTVTHSAVGPMYAMGTPIPPHHHQGSDGMTERKKKKEEKDREKHEKDKDKPKKKNTTAYQVFCKEYRVNINAEQPGLVFGELSKKLAEVWKAMPEKDKLVWRQKAQYLQHKQNKAEATTIKHKSSSESKSKVVGTGTGMVSPDRATGTMSLSPARVPDVDPIDAAAHLQLLGESLSLIGHRLQETEGMVAVSGSLSVLLDSILCALGPLTCLTSQIPQLNGCPRNVLSNTLDNIAYIMPGL
ncbi:HMG domain-containing protein 4a [Xiphias gladius]|uniref:HMG domain-containing protein 4a n=1 Tax=Xiphias gladius TaxID=8245 RepID=UPI001A982515|nr:HMG domain-containing protein 4a [Xiphias gladius]XP_039980292.1 HMG domain-containing protein 4a [Xiphias gladius]XP_039980293.1 HMG domain-containing protein 4a [Xiphias gladius]XP_039980294.1 HMG domain-containing protein 4a [Xiphias gladius]